MKATILLNHSDNTHQVEEEEKARFLRGILEQCFDGTDTLDRVQEIWAMDGPLSTIERVKLRSILSTYNIQVIDNLDGQMKVYLEKELIGEWRKCTYSLKRDYNVLDPRHRVYLEMHVDCWTIFDPTEEESAET